MQRNINILITDDHYLFRKGLKDTIIDHPKANSIKQCETGGEAIDLIKNKTFDIVFMDIRMQVLNGIETTKRIRTFNTSIKIIGLSMLDDKASIVNMFKSGANGFLNKSTSKEELFSAIDTVLANEFYISNSIPQSIKGDLRTSAIHKAPPLNWKFTKRESDILKLICQGYSNKETSEILSISIKTVEAYKTRLLEKTGANNSAGIVRFAFEYNLIS